MLSSISWPNFIVRLPFLFEILGNICIAVVCFPGCHVIIFDILVLFLIKPFFYITKNSRQKFKYLENKKSFQGEIKNIFLSFFKGLSDITNFLRPESLPLDHLTPMLLSCRNQSNKLQCKLFHWFLYDDNISLKWFKCRRQSIEQPGERKGG